MIDQGFSNGANIDRAFLFLFGVAVGARAGDGGALLLRFAAGRTRGRRHAAAVVFAPASASTPASTSRTRSGELVSRLTADAELLRSVVGSSMSVALRSIITGGRLDRDAVRHQPAPGRASRLVGIPLAVLPIVIGGRRLQKFVARQPGSRRRCQHAAPRNARRHADRAGARARAVRARALRPRRSRIAVDTARRRIRIAGDRDRDRHRADLRRDHAGAVVGRARRRRRHA